VVIGLGIDIAGAFLILSPLLHLYKRFWGDVKPDMDSESHTLSAPQKETANAQLRDQREARMGFVLLVIGFTIQIIGNLMLDRDIKMLLNL